MKLFSTLKARIIFVSGLSILIIASALIFSAILAKQESESRYQNEAFNGKRLLWHRIVEGEVNAMRSELFSITRNSNAMSALSDGDAAELASQLQPTFNRLKASKVIDGMQILSKNGAPVFARPEKAAHVTSTGLVKDALATGKIKTGIEHDSNNNLNVVFAIPLYKSPGNVSGVGIYTRSLKAVISEFKRSEGSDIYVVAKNGNMMFSTNDELYQGIQPSLPALGERQYQISKLDDKVYAVLTQSVTDAKGKHIAHMMNVSEYTESYNAQNSIQLYSILIAIGVIAIVLLTLNWYIGRSLKPLNEVKTVLTAVADGDLTSEINISSNDEIGQILASVDAMVTRLRHMIKDVTQSTMTMASSSNEMLGITETTSNGVQQQQQQIELVATAMNEMTSTVQEVANHAQQAADSATHADQEASQGRQIVDETTAAIGSLEQEIESAAVVIKKVESDSVQIGTVLDVIKSIAEQTNLLALNAAIEAARAGEQGRGFAVVADEVRTLASRTQQSTQEIHEMIEQLQNGAQEAVAAMANSQEKATSAVERAASAGNSLSAITEKVTTISQMNLQIATAADEQSKVSEEINQNVVDISRVAEQSADGARQTAVASGELSEHASQVQQLVSQFRV